MAVVASAPCIARESALTHQPLEKNGRHFAEHIFKCIFLNDKVCILIKISLEFIPKGPIDNNPASGWGRIGDKPSSQPMPIWFTDANMRHEG